MNNKYVVVTGASSGIGYETAKAFANRGKNLIICARRTERLLQLKEEIQKEHPYADVVVKAVDLSNEKAVVDFYRSLREYDIEVFEITQVWEMTEILLILIWNIILV